MDALSALPSDVASTRDILFKLPIPFSLSLANHERFWPLIDNAYVIRKTRHVTRKDPHILYYVICRFGRKRSPIKPIDESKRTTTTKRDDCLCNVAFRILKYTNHVEFRPLAAHPTNHNHSLDQSDTNKE